MGTYNSVYVCKCMYMDMHKKICTLYTDVCNNMCKDMQKEMCKETCKDMCNDRWHMWLQR